MVVHGAVHHGVGVRAGKRRAANRVAGRGLGADRGDVGRVVREQLVAGGELLGGFDLGSGFLELAGQRVLKLLDDRGSNARRLERALRGERGARHESGSKCDAYCDSSAFRSAFQNSSFPSDASCRPTYSSIWAILASPANPTSCAQALDEFGTQWAQGKQNPWSGASTNLKNFYIGSSGSHFGHRRTLPFGQRV